MAGSPERATVSVVPRAASLWLPVCGGRRWGTRRGALISRPEHRTLGLSPLVHQGGGGGLAAGPVKENGIKALCPRLTLCTGPVGFGSRSQAFLPLQRRKRQGRWLPPDRGQQARQPAGKGQDREIGAGTWQPGRAAWSGLDWAVTATAFAPFSVGPPAIPVRLRPRPRPRRCRLVISVALLLLLRRDRCSCALHAHCLE